MYKNKMQADHIWQKWHIPIGHKKTTEFMK